MYSRINLILKVLIVFTCIFYLIGLERLPINYDEGAFATGAQMILDGAQIYKDFFEYRTPGIFYFNALFFSLLGDSIFALRLIVVLISLFSVYVFYKIVKKMDGERTALLTAFLILASRYFLDAHLPLFTEGITNAFTIFALYFLLYRRPKAKDYLLAGLLLGVSFLFKQTSLVVLLAIVLFLLYKNRSKEAAYFAAPFIAVALALAALFSYADLFYYLFTFGTQISTMELFTKIRVWLLFLFPVMWLGYIYVFRETLHKRVNMLSAILLLVTLSLLPLKELWGHSFLQVLFFAAYFASKAVLELLKNKRKIIVIGTVLLLLAALISFLQFATAQKLTCYYDSDSNCNTMREAQLSVAGYLQERPGSVFSDAPVFYYLLDKKPVYHTYGIIGAPVSVFGLSDLVPALEQNKTDYLIMTNYIYTEKVTSYGLPPYIQENYNKVFEKGIYMVFERK